MHLLWITLIVLCTALAGWYITDKFAPDELLNKIVKIVIFLGVAWWVIFKLLPMVAV